MKRIVICSDGTWNRPEADPEQDHATNVLRIARSIEPVDAHGIEQVVFYDWGLGSYHDGMAAGTFGAGIDKNIQDGYRFLVQNYALGDEIYFFGFSRGAFTVRSLAGFINNCGILKRENASLIGPAFAHYKDPDRHPDDDFSRRYRNRHSVRARTAQLGTNELQAYTEDGHPKVHFIGVWDTVGALGVPLSFLGFLNQKHMFHDNKIGPNIRYARHALAIDERRDDFKPTIWKQRRGVDIEQVWFAGCHSDVGGGLPPAKDGSRLSDIPLDWIATEAEAKGLTLSLHLRDRMNKKATSPLNESYEGKWKLAGENKRGIPARMKIHASVKQRYDRRSTYRPEKLERRVRKHGWGTLVP